MVNDGEHMVVGKQSVIPKRRIRQGGEEALYLLIVGSGITQLYYIGFHHGVCMCVCPPNRVEKESESVCD